MKKLYFIMLAALSLTACKRDSSVVYLNGDDDDIIIRVDDGMKVNLTVNWSDLATAPDGMTVYLYPTGNDTVDNTVRSWHFDNVQSASVTVPEQDYSVICFNQSENELAGYVFDFRDYATATVTAKDLSNLAPLAIASMSSLQSTRALNLMGVLKPVNVVKTMSLKIHVAGFNERVEVKGTLSNMPAGVTMCDRKPLPKPVDLTLPAKDWTVKATSDDEIDLDITFNSFGIFLDDETRAAGSGDDDYVAETRVALDDNDLRNILHLEITAEDGTVTKLDYDVTQELIRQYRIAIESEATQQESEPAFKNQLNYSYNKADTTATLISGVAMGDVEIPAYVEHDGLAYKVTGIGSGAFRYCVYMTSVSFPETVTRIGSSAFENCAGLSSISLPESLTFIGSYAFEHCRSLTEVTIPEQIDSIGTQAFSYCLSLTTVNYNAKHCSYCGGSIFNRSDVGITTLNIGSQVKYIPDNAFDYLEKLTTVTIPESVTSIGEDAFRGCTNLTSITIPESVTSIGEYAFYGIVNVVYNGSAEGAPWGAAVVNGAVEDDFVFADAEKTQLVKYYGKEENVTIPATVTAIYANAFSNSNLKEVTIPESVTSIEDNAFYGVGNIIYNGSAEGAPWGATAMNGEIPSLANHVWKGHIGSYIRYSYGSSGVGGTTCASYLLFEVDPASDGSSGSGYEVNIFPNHPIKYVRYDFDWVIGYDRILLSYKDASKSYITIYDYNLGTKTFNGYYYSNTSSGVSFTLNDVDENDFSIEQYPNSYEWNPDYEGSVISKITDKFGNTLYDGSNGHRCYDLGLPSGLLWADCNIGVDSDFEKYGIYGNAGDVYGDYFAWGETFTHYSSKWFNYTTENTTWTDNTSWIEGYGAGYSSSNYLYGSGSDILKYNDTDNLTTLEASDDAARAIWGGNWRIPTSAEWDELVSNCTWTDTTLYGVDGFEVKGPNGNTIFLPSAGYFSGSSRLNPASGLYWSSSLYERNFTSGINIRTGSGTRNTSRCYGLPVRAVLGMDGLYDK
ncbi:MAG: DUF5119 domain-containing protein [Bacteroidales bacterium]|jgi:hypothetical protein|nr:DUF5119 domain-containing protein [Bacteroidales bacterium]